MKSLRAKSTVNSVAVTLGGEFALLSNSEERHKALLAEGAQRLSNAEAALAAERSRASALQAALERAGEAANLAQTAANNAQRATATLEARVVADAVAMRELQTELASLEEEDALLDERAYEDAGALGVLSEALDEERARATNLSLLLSEKSAALEAAEAREAALHKTLDEERQRTKRFAASRAEKEKQLAVALNEKNRISQLLSKKDTLARDLSASLKTHEQLAAQRAAALMVQQQRRKVVKAQTVLAIGEAAAEQALPPQPEAPKFEAPTRAPMSAAEAVAAEEEAAAKAADEAQRMSSRAPGAQKRFDGGWRNASGAQREAALRSENAVLIGVLAERDQALKFNEAEMRRLRAEHASMLVKWRGATKELRKLQPAAAAASTLRAELSSLETPVPGMGTPTLTQRQRDQKRAEVYAINKLMAASSPAEGGNKGKEEVEQVETPRPHTAPSKAISSSPPSSSTAPISPLPAWESPL